jgi:hypothetical protein
MLMTSLFLRLWLMSATGAGPAGVTGVAYDQNGTPSPFVTIVARDETGSGFAAVTNTDASGAFAFTSLPPGWFAVGASSPKLGDACQRQVHVVQARVVDLSFVLQPSLGAGTPPDRCEVERPRCCDPYDLIISEEGQRDVRIHVLGVHDANKNETRMHLLGWVRGQQFGVKVAPVELEGSLAGEPVWIWMHGEEAEGHIGGHEVGFSLHTTPGGFLLRGQAVGHTVRLEESHGFLSWMPACERPLLRLPRGPTAEVVYQGACASGRRMRLVLPDTLGRVPPLPRLILLALLLTEREGETGAVRLFPAKELP